MEKERNFLVDQVRSYPLNKWMRDCGSSSRAIAKDTEDFNEESIVA